MVGQAISTSNTPNWGEWHTADSVVLMRVPSLDHRPDRLRLTQDATTRAVRLIQMSPAAMRSLADGDLSDANKHSSVPLGPYFIGDECRYVWKLRGAQVEADPKQAPWVARVIYDPRYHISVGRAGFHRPPNARGMVEVGYSVDPEHRRKGYARAALTTLINRATCEPSARVLRAAIRLDNEASRNLALQCGLVAVGEQWTDEDGLEVVYEIEVGH